MYQYNLLGDTMNGILFLFLAFFTIIVTIKMVEYAEILKNNITNSFIKRFLSFIIIGLPILITYFTSIFINNSYMAIGNIIGSNVFNLCILAILDLYFIKKCFFNKISHRFFYINSLIIYIYIVIINTFMLKNSQSLPTILIIVFYFIYIFFASKIKLNKKIVIKNNKYKLLKTKFLIAFLLVILFSIALTLYTDYLTFNYPQYSSTVIGAFLLGITTSLPKVISSYLLIKNNNYNVTVSNITGSNMFNFLLLALTDILFKGPIYFFVTEESLFIIKMSLYINLLFFIYVVRIKSLSKITYIIPSLLIIIIYIYIWKILIIG